MDEYFDSTSEEIVIRLTFWTSTDDSLDFYHPFRASGFY